jgi:hypothetical protein
MYGNPSRLKGLPSRYNIFWEKLEGLVSSVYINRTPSLGSTIYYTENTLLKKREKYGSGSNPGTKYLSKYASELVPCSHTSVSSASAYAKTIIKSNQSIEKQIRSPSVIATWNLLSETHKILLLMHLDGNFDILLPF